MGGTPSAPKPFSVRQGGRLDAAFARGLGVGFGGRGAGFGDHPAQHVDEQPRQRQVRPGRVGGDVEEDDEALAAPRRGDERRAVGEARPGLVGEARLRLGQHLPADGHFVGDGETEKRAALLEGRDVFRGLPRQRAPEGPAAASERRRDEVVVASGEARAGEADEDAAVVEKPGDGVAFRPRGDAHVGQHENRGLLGEQRNDRIAGRIAPFADVGVGRERAPDIVAGRDQRLRGVGCGAGSDRHPAPSGAVVDQPDRAGRTVAVDHQSLDFVAQLDRQLEADIDSQVCAEVEGRAPDLATLGVERPGGAHRRRGHVGADEMRLQRSGLVVCAGDRANPDPVGDHVDRPREPRHPRGEVVRAAEFDPVGDPQHVRARRRRKIPFDRRRRRVARRSKRRRGERPQPPFDLAGVQRDDIAPALREGFDRDRPPGAGRGEHLLPGVSDTLFECPGRRPAVVEEDQQRTRSVKRSEVAPQGLGHRHNDQRRDREAQDQDRPRRSRGLRLLRREPDEEPERRKRHAARRRRGDPEEVVEGAEAREGDEHSRRCKGERKAEHGLRRSGMRRSRAQKDAS